jgi:collagen type III alpha
MELFNRGQGDSKASGGLLATPVWGQGWADTDVVGESNYGEAIRRLLPKGLGEDGEEVFIDVLLVREPGNRYDRNAIAVRAETGTVGYLPRETAVRYSPVLDTLASSGGVAQTSARVWGCIRQEWDSNRKSFSGSVRIALPEPHMLFPANPPPEAPHAVLPVGPAIQVTGEENYRSNLKPWLNSHGEAWVHATLHPVVEATARTSKTLAEVRIDGLPVGRLTPKMSQDMLPAVDYLAERGLIACVRGVVKGNALKSDVVLYSARAGDLAAEWLDSLESGDQAGAVPKVELPAGQAGAVSDPAAANAAAPAPPPAGLPPANWYPDPHGVARLRYWDGAQWTDHTAE